MVTFPPTSEDSVWKMPTRTWIQQTTTNASVYGLQNLKARAYKFYKTGRVKFPRYRYRIQHANPYYDDSYAVNSAKHWAVWHAIMHELVPEM